MSRGVVEVPHIAVLLGGGLYFMAVILLQIINYEKTLGMLMDKLDILGRHTLKNTKRILIIEKKVVLLINNIDNISESKCEPRKIW